MYDPTLGRWLEQDPIGFDGGDMNLYRMEGNDPVNEFDPSGLEGERIRELHFEFINPWFTANFTNTEKKIIVDNTWAAVKRIEKAYIMLKYHWDELKGLSTMTLSNGKLFLSPRYRKLAEGKYIYAASTPAMWECFGSTDIVSTISAREMYLSLMDQVLTPLRNKEALKFEPDRSPPTPNGRAAGVLYTLGIPGNTISIYTNIFFFSSKSRQIDVLRHELGRKIGFGQENTGDLFHDVYEWDLTIDYLADKYDELMNRK